MMFLIQRSLFKYGVVVFLLVRTLLAESPFPLFQLLYDATNQYNESIPDTKQFYSEYDFIIIGAGSGGSVMANRLSEENNWTILLLEAGDEESFISDVPLTPGITGITRYNWGYKAEKQSGACTQLKGGVCNWPKGRALGGTSVINFMIYQRGHKKDYDDWAKAGNDGWSYDEVLPYFRKSENIGIPELSHSKYHGINGYLDVQYAKYRTPLSTAFVKSAQEFGYQNNDPNADELLGFSYPQATIRNGRRCSAAKAFLRPVIDRSNLHISTRARVTKIIIDPLTKTAVGVEFLKNKKYHRLIARKEVILSAGSIASPQILMLSGIGPRDNLESLGIPLIKELSVGHNLQDHVCVNGLEFIISKPVSISESYVQNPAYILDYVLNGSGPYTIPGGAEGLAFIKTDNASSPLNYPDIEIVLGAGGLGGDISGTLRDMLGITDEFFQKVYKGVIGKHAFGLVPILLRPKSRGRISLKSTNPFHWPKMEPNFYSNQQDLATLIKGIRMCLAIAEAKSLKRFGTKFHKTPFPGCENYEFNSDKYWECCIRGYASSLQHQVGTCKMGPASDPNSVVNSQLQIHGVNNLRVVDASIMPTIPAGHTNAAVFMIGEKGADLVKEYWKNSVFK